MEIPPRAMPDLELPRSNNIVCVRAIDSTTRMTSDSFAFVQPPIRGNERMNFNTMCFLLEHQGKDGLETILFDCGSRKDYWNGSPVGKKLVGSLVPGLEVEYGVDEILVSAGFDLQNLRAIVWSHWHWDHIGDGSKFPPTTDIVVGPGFVDNFAPGWPHTANGCVLASDLEGHRVHEPEFDLMIGGFPAHDYFGDGSFYLLDVPGHAIGHICGLARTTPDTFVFLGGDCCHSAGVLRPTVYQPMPPSFSSRHLDSYYSSPCPCSAFIVNHPAGSSSEPESIEARTQPFFKIPIGHNTAFTDGYVAQQSIDKLLLFDAHPNIFICLSHDESLFHFLPLYNEGPNRDINDWKAKGYKESSRWYFLNELPKDGKPGRDPLVVGLKRDGKAIAWTEEKGFYDLD